MGHIQGSERKVQDHAQDICFDNGNMIMDMSVQRALN